jgi:hypothetical protein
MARAFWRVDAGYGGIRAAWRHRLVRRDGVVCVGVGVAVGLERSEDVECAGGAENWPRRGVGRTCNIYVIWKHDV